MIRLPVNLMLDFAVKHANTDIHVMVFLASFLGYIWFTLQFNILTWVGYLRRPVTYVQELQIT